MRAAQALLLLCLAVALAVVVYAAKAQLRDVEQTIRDGEQRAVLAELRQTAKERARELDDDLRFGPPVATYDRDGQLLRPAPLARARRFSVPGRTLTAVHLARGRIEEAERAAQTSAERVQVLLAKGDEQSLVRVLDEPSAQGTELAYMVRLKLLQMRKQEPDEMWHDDVSALVGGPSERFAYSLLARVGMKPIGTPGDRILLAALTVRPGVFRSGGYLYRAEPLGDKLILRSWALRDFGDGELTVRLPAPYDAVEVHGSVDEAVVRKKAAEKRPRVILIYSGAALFLIVGTIYAYLAIGRSYRLADEKSDFVANVTHELKTPLANIRLYAETLRAGRVKTAEDRDDFLDTILEEGRRLEDLVEGLLHAARGPKLRMERLDPASLLRESADRWGPRLDREGFTLTTQCETLPEIRGDREALLRALDNLLDNARKYGQEDKRILLRGRADNGKVRLAVRDHGTGIPVGDRERVLKPFTRLESADRKETPGTGLGLSLVVSTMEAHGGRVDVGKAAGGGAEVTLVLPVEQA
jgi:signal transduction histidine kinase